MRDRVLHEAATLFIAKGYRYTALSEVAGKLDITKAALYYHFKSKDEILMSLVNPLMERIEVVLAEGAKAPRTKQDRRRLLQAYAEAMRMEPRAAAILRGDINVNGHPEIAPRVRGHLVDLVALLLDEDSDNEARLRAIAAIDLIGMHMIKYSTRRSLVEEISPQEHQEIAMNLALELLEGRTKPAARRKPATEKAPGAKAASAKAPSAKA